MKRRFVFLSLVFATATMARGQAIRTWVSGTGDDANPCNRVAPCKTYAGAIGKTAPGGVISVIDAGAYGAVTITKSITIEGTGTLASSIHANSNGIVINAAATDVVVLRNLTLHGGGTGTNGVHIVQAGEVYIEDCHIQNSAGDGIDIAPAGTSTLTRVFVRNSSIVNNGGKGIEILPTGDGAKATLVVEGSAVSGNGSNGISVAGLDNSAAIHESRITSNGVHGLHVLNASSTLFADSSLIAYNKQSGIQAGLGAQAPVIHISRCTISGNTTNGIGGNGTVVGFSNNVIAGNGGNNSVSSSVQPQ